MCAQTRYDSPLGTLLLTADESALLTACFTDSPVSPCEASPILTEAAVWLDNIIKLIPKQGEAVKRKHQNVK